MHYGHRCVRRVREGTGPTLVAFIGGAVGVVIGTCASFRLFGPSLGVDGWKVAACLCASYIGAAANAWARIPQPRFPNPDAKCTQQWRQLEPHGIQAERRQI
jgi:uncharacterized membrane protein